MSVACGRYQASFALDDPDAVVDAALSCPACLSGDSRLVVRMAGPHLDAQGTCALCGSTWSLELGPHQLMRLGFDPPRFSRVVWTGNLPLSPPGPIADRDD
jgi:hypothetical protein